MRRRGYLPIPLELEEVPCPTCAGRETTVLLRFDAFGFPTPMTQCAQCGQVYMNPRPTAAYLNNFYCRKYRRFYEGLRRTTDRYIKKRRWEEWARYRLSKYSELLSEGIEVLDIGCGAGLFLDAVRRSLRSTITVGIEPDPVLADHAEKRLGLEVHRGFFDTFACPRRFDLITAFHTLEHLPDLGAFFEFGKSHLKRGGRVVVETPNVGGAWKGIGMFHLVHLYAFTPHTISNLFRVNGFEVERVAAVENDLEHSNLYLIGTQGSAPPTTQAWCDQEECARIESKCRQLHTQRYHRIVRTWTKLALQAIRG